MRILIAGANGFIGRYLVRELAEIGHEVITVVRKPVHVEGAHSNEIVDITDSENLCMAVANIAPDIVVNAAARGVQYGDRNIANMYAVNFHAAIDLLNAAAMVDVQRFIQLGSCFEYGSYARDIRENFNLRPNSVYALSKAAASQAVLNLGPALGVDVTVLRLFSLWGVGEQSERLVPQIIKASRNQTSLSLTDGTQVRDYLHVEDAAQMLAALTVHPDLPAGCAVNVASGKAISVRDFTLRIAGRLAAIDYLDFGALPQRIDEHSRLVADISSLRTLLGVITDRSDLFAARLSAQVNELTGSVHQQPMAS